MVRVQAQMPISCMCMYCAMNFIIHSFIHSSSQGKNAYVVGNHALGDSYTTRSRVLAWSGIVVGAILAAVFIAAISGLIYWQETN